MSRRAVILLLGLVSSAIVIGSPGVSAGGGCHAASTDQTAARASGNATIPIKGCRYSPTVTFVEEGAEVTWVNKDAVPHSVTGAFLSLHGERLLEEGDRATYRFDETGVFPYYCVLHPGMAGAVVVGDVSAAKEAAEPIEAMPVAVTEPKDPGSDRGGEETSSSAALPVAVGLGVVALGALALWLRRARHTALAQPDSVAGS